MTLKTKKGNRKKINKITQLKSWFFENISKIDRFLVTMITKKNERKEHNLPISRMKEDITRDC